MIFYFILKSNESKILLYLKLSAKLSQYLFFSRSTIILELIIYKQYFIKFMSLKAYLV